MISRSTVLFAVTIISLAWPSLSWSEPPASLNIDPVQVLRSSDRARGGIKEGLTWHSKVTTTEDEETTEREFIIKAKGDNAYVEALLPIRTKGEVFIFNDRTMWFFKPSLKKPVSISPREKFSGQAANGDIASTNYARDYTPTLERVETDGANKVAVLMLKAKAANLTYDQIRYWIDLKKNLAVKAEFLTLQGQVFKTATIEYANSVTAGGEKFPFVSRFTISDAKFPANKSVLEYFEPKVTELSQSLFNVGNLAR